MTLEESLRLDQRIDAAVEKLESAAERLIRVETSCPLHATRLVAVEEACFGNGKEGLLLRVDRIEQKARAVWAIASGAMALVGAAIGALASWFTR